MDFFKNNKDLILTNEELLKEQKEFILAKLKNGEHIYVFFDTETTGKEPYPKYNVDGELIKRDRIVEVGFVFYGIDSKGELNPIKYKDKSIIFHEYIDPSMENKKDLENFKSKEESDKEALVVHGITTNFLKGKESLGNVRLNKNAPTFNQIRPYMDDILCVKELPKEDVKGKIIAIGHNSIEFDNRFLSMEMERDDQMFNPEIESLRSFESMVSDVWDTMIFMKDLWTRNELIELNKDKSFDLVDNFGRKMNPGYSMSYFAHILGVKEEGREEFHGALLDADILAKCFCKFIKHPKYKNAPNKLPIPAPVFDFIKEKTGINYQIPKFESQSGQAASEGEVLNLIKTDASLQEGTGTFSEYVSIAAKNGLKNLAMIDNVTLINFIPFYKKCIENEIKPIAGANFKLESYADVDYCFFKNKKHIDEINNITMAVLENLNVEPWIMTEKLLKEKFENVNLLNKYIKGIFEAHDKITAEKKPATTTMNKLLNAVKNDIASICSEINITVDKAALKKLNNEKLESIFKNILGEENVYREIAEFNRVLDYPDLTLIAKNEKGYDNIKKIVTNAQKDGKRFEKKGKLEKGEFPILSFDMIKETEGVFVMVGDFNDIIGRSLKIKSKNVANELLLKLREKFGKNVILDVNSKLFNADENIKRHEASYLKDLDSFAIENRLKGVATHHASFANKDDFDAHKNKSSILLDKRTDSLSNKFREYSAQHLMKVSEYAEIFKQNEKLMENTSSLLSNIEMDLDLDVPKLPNYPTPNGENEIEYFKQKTEEGFLDRVKIAFKNYCKVNNIDVNNKEEKSSFYKKYKERLDYEMKIIIDMGFPGYFLIKQDMIEFCKKNNIPVGSGRGSAAGSLVVYSLGITNIDPIEYGLIFERFLNPERKEMPDIDTDISGDDREKVLHYLNEKYSMYGEGYAGAAYIITKSTFSAKSTVRALAKAKKMTVQWQNELAELIPKTPDITLEESLFESEKLAYRYENETMTREIINAAMKLEGPKRQRATGKHAGGIVVGNLIKNSPLEFDGDIPVVQYDKNNIESAGGVKFDLLGLGTLKIVDLAVKNILKSKGEEALRKFGIRVDGEYVNFNELDYYDKGTFQLLAEANSSNVFQVESDGMKDLLRKIKPKNLEEISALVALFRPGPLESGMVNDYINGKNDSSNIHYDHEVLKPILETTYGAILYQEQVMEISRVMAGYTMGGADKLRKAMGKKKPEEMEKQRAIFIEGAKKNGFDEDLATNIFNKMEKFAGYGFNKSHAVCYGDLSYKTALLKKHFPQEYMSAVLTLVSEGNDASNKIEKAISSAKESNLKIKTPDINVSRLEYFPNENGDLLYGLLGIKGASFDDILEERKKSGKYKNIEDILLRNNTKSASKSAMEGLIMSGALDKLPLIRKFSPKKDFLGLNPLEKIALKRILLMKEYHEIKDLLSNDKKKKEYTGESIVNYADVETSFYKNKSLKVKEMLIKEHEILSAYITAHPIDVGGIREKLKDDSVYPKLSDIRYILENAEPTEGEQIRTVGVVKFLDFNMKSAKGNSYGKLIYNDGTGDNAVFLFSDQIDSLKEKFNEKVGRPMTEGDVISVLATYKTRLNKNTGDDETALQNDFIEIPEYDLNIQINDYARPYEPRKRNLYKM